MARSVLCSAREHQAGKRAEWDGLAVSPRYKFRNETLIHRVAGDHPRGGAPPANAEKRARMSWQTTSRVY
jgi:hypothetical protein